MVGRAGAVGGVRGGRGFLEGYGEFVLGLFELLFDAHGHPCAGNDRDGQALLAPFEAHAVLMPLAL